MKIGLVCPYNMFRGGGVQECVLALREGIVARGHEAYIITPQPSDYKESPPEGFIFVGTGRMIRASHTTSDLAVSIDIARLQEVLDTYQFDILHFHEPWVPIISRQLLSRSNAIHIATFHAAMSERRTSRTFEKVIIPYTKSILKYLDVMTAVSPTATNYVRSLTNRKIKIVPNGIDLSRYNHVETTLQPKSPKQILYVGRLEKRKGVNYLLNAFKELLIIDPGYSLLIVGDGPDREKLEDQVMLNAIPNVRFLGYVDDETKQRLLKESAVFCSPALYGESFGIVLLEAMASGCVTVAGNNSGYASVLQDEGQISLVNPKDSLEFARRLHLLATNLPLRELWRKWALGSVSQYEYSEVVDQYVAIYKEAYEKHKH